MKKIQRQEQRTIIGRFIVQASFQELVQDECVVLQVLCHLEETTIGFAARSPFHCSAVDVVNNGRFRIWIVQDLHIQVLEDNFPNRRKQNGLFRKSLQICKR